MKRSLPISLLLNLALVAWLLSQPPPPARADGVKEGPAGNGDVNGDGRLDLSDAIYLLSFLFTGGTEPAPIVSGTPGGGLPATGQIACYDDRLGFVSCSSPDYPGQDGLYRAGCPAAGRFIDNGDGTVTDSCTGLLWQKDPAPAGSYTTWVEALEYCEGLTLAGHDDWRLPNVRELESLVDYGRIEPAAHPVLGALPTWYWSSTTVSRFPRQPFGVDFYDGRTGFDLGPGLPAVRAVRDLP